VVVSTGRTGIGSSLLGRQRGIGAGLSRAPLSRLKRRVLLPDIAPRDQNLTNFGRGISARKPKAEVRRNKPGLWFYRIEQLD
jgi:hypothetical protein